MPNNNIYIDIKANEEDHLERGMLTSDLVQPCKGVLSLVSLVSSRVRLGGDRIRTPSKSELYHTIILITFPKRWHLARYAMI